MTPALSLYLLAAARAEPLMSRGPPTPGSRAQEPTSGEIVWIHLGTGEAGESAVALASRIAEGRPKAGFVVTSDVPGDTLEELPRVSRPADFPRSVEAFLSEWAPSVCVWVGGPIWPVLAAKARQLEIPMILVNATDTLASSRRGIPARDLLGLFTKIAARGDLDRKALERAARRPIDVIGRLQRSSQPLDYDEGERLRFAAALQARPVWFAAGATVNEAEVLCQAHAAGQGASHRLLLIVQPVDADAAAALLQRHGAQRSVHRVPAPGVPVFIADVPGEEGLWYRLASVSFIGGSLSGPNAMTDPFAPAALGSAIVHGPVLSPFASHFTALSGAGATRQVRNSEGLGRAIADLLAPDRAADLAHRAWSVVSEGAEATDHVAEAVARLLDGAD